MPHLLLTADRHFGWQMRGWKKWFIFTFKANYKMRRLFNQSAQSQAALMPVWILAQSGDVVDCITQRIAYKWCFVWDINEALSRVEKPITWFSVGEAETEPILMKVAVLLCYREMDTSVTSWMTGECSSWTCITATSTLGTDMQKVCETTMNLLLNRCF